MLIRSIFAFALLLSSQRIALVQEIKGDETFWTVQTVQSNASLRGLSVISDKIAWASGTGGTVIRTVDGKHWETISVASEVELDFRDIEAFSENKAIVVSAGSPGKIFLTIDGGRHWENVYQDNRPEIFFDAMAFVDKKHGFVFGDPIDGKAEMVFTDDGGQTWKKIDADDRPVMNDGEAGFAASGTCMIASGNQLFIATGGQTDGKTFSRFVSADVDQRKWTSVDTPIIRNASSGIFSLAVSGETIVAVGGDYLQAEKAENHIAVSDDLGNTWKAVSGSTPSGYRSAVAVAKNGNKDMWIAVGPSGTDVSVQPDQQWTSVSKGAFHAVAFAPGGNVAWASGPDGRIGKWIAK
jgi:photosystem II stability/assembly factor-like uncharacterized protein